MPAYFKQKEIDLLPLKLKVKIERVIEKLQGHYRNICMFFEKTIFHNKPIVVYEEFLWAWYSVNSRSVFYKDDLCSYFEDDSNNIALAPYLDLLNHSCSANVSIII